MSNEDDSDQRIGEGLVTAGVMSQEQVDAVLKRQRSGDDSLFGVIALELGYVDPDSLVHFLESKGL